MNLLLLFLISLYVFIYSSVMLDTQFRHETIEDRTREKRVIYTYSTMGISLISIVSVVVYYRFSEYLRITEPLI